MKEEESVEILKILGLISNIKEYQKMFNMNEENISQQFRLKKKKKRLSKELFHWKNKPKWIDE